ncbi:MAG: DUF1573 domain-containing protein [Prevotellaceae bacterium]|jgi:hypothetical protein|nr:DUF1573 domain-containing protein [Prevotellaceae bacterium]
MKNVLKSTFLLIALSLAVAVANAQTGRIVFDNSAHNFGNNIPEKGGDVTHRFIFTNTGDAPVTIQNVTASCGCTTPAWTKEPVAPGQQGFVDATYRPNGRPGNFSKNLTVTSNGEPKMLSLSISGVVVKAPLTVEEEFPVALAGIRLSEKAFAFSRVFITESRTSDIKVYNSSENPVEISFKNLPEYLKIAPVTLQPKQKGKITCTFASTKKSKLGTTIDNIELFVNGQKLQETLTSTATVIPLPSQAVSGDKNAPKPVLSFKNSNYVFSNIKQGSMVSNEFKFTNAGQADLEIIAVNVVNTNNDNIKVTFPKITKAGEEGTVKVVLNTKKLKGTQDFNIEIITNVSSNPVSNIAFRGNIVE